MPGSGRRSPESREARRERRASVTDQAVVMEAAAAFLAVRPRSVAETRRRLRHLGYPEALTHQVVERLGDMGYLDDEAFARAWVESRDRARPRGEAALRRELALKGVDRGVVDQLLAQRADVPHTAAPEASAAPSADMAAACRLLERRAAAFAREPDPRKRRQRAYALLARNGFDPEVCREAAAGIEVPGGKGAGRDDG